MMVARDMLSGFNQKLSARRRKRERAERMLERDRQERRKIRMLKPRAALFSTKKGECHQGVRACFAGALWWGHLEVVHFTNGPSASP